MGWEPQRLVFRILPRPLNLKISRARDFKQAYVNAGRSLQGPSLMAEFAPVPVPERSFMIGGPLPVPGGAGQRVGRGLASEPFRQQVRLCVSQMAQRAVGTPQVVPDSPQGSAGRGGYCQQQILPDGHDVEP